MNKRLFLIPVGALFLTGLLSGMWTVAGPVDAQTNNQTTAETIDQLTANLTQAKQAIASGNTTATTAQADCYNRRTIRYSWEGNNRSECRIHRRAYSLLYT